MRNILVAGGTGSFAREFISYALTSQSVEKIIVFSRDEYKQHQMRVEGFTDPRLRYFLGDIRDYNRLCRAMHDVDTVIHAAALKQVPSCEYNYSECIETNVGGSLNIADAAIDCGVERAILLSSDKATEPANTYGKSKALAESIFINANAYASGTDTKLSVVRYGNVIGSRGSVIPLFLQQKEAGKITITDSRMTRFWMTLQQAVFLVADSLGKMQGGEIFIPSLPSCKVTDIAEAIAPDCKQEIIGIRPGEKLHETLISEIESANTVKLGERFIIYPQHTWFERKRYIGEAMPISAYSSDTNEQRLTIPEIREMVSRL